MPKPNYSFEKRQRELAKKRKKEDKIAERAARKTGGPDDAAGHPVEADSAPTPSDTTAPAGPSPAP